MVCRRTCSVWQDDSCSLIGQSYNWGGNQAMLVVGWIPYLVGRYFGGHFPCCVSSPSAAPFAPSNSHSPSRAAELRPRNSDRTLTSRPADFRFLANPGTWRSATRIPGSLCAIPSSKLNLRASSARMWSWRLPYPGTSRYDSPNTFCNLGLAFTFLRQRYMLLVQGKCLKCCN